MQAYGGTITFGGNISLQEKKIIIDSIPRIFSEYLRHNDSSEYYLRYVIEYHKVENLSDYESPHIHFILYTQKQLCKWRYSAILNRLKDIGRSQFYLMTTLKRNVYEKYIEKEVESNDQVMGFPHDYYVRLEEQVDTLTEINSILYENHYDDL